MVQEWTMTAKSGGAMSFGRNGQTRAQGNWYQYTVDLSAYAGQKYIGIRHFNCTDQFILNVDDIALTAGSKGINLAKGGEFFSQYAEDGAMLNFFALDNVNFRVYILYKLSNDSRFSLVPEEDYGQFVLTSNVANLNFMDEFEMAYQNAIADFNLLSKVDIDERINGWKSSVSSFNLTSVMMDVLLSNARVDNDHCVNSLPFCTSETITFEAASTSNTANEPGMDDGCIGSSYNPSFYHMRIHTAGPFVIHMEGHDPNNPSTTRDIDFCMWGPYTEQEVISGSACSNLTGNKIMDCCYSASYTEDCYLGYAEGQHVHNTSHGTINYHVPEVGEYYILMITNFSQQPCVINFTKTEGEGETDCEIVTPTDLIGFLITEDGEFVAFAGPDDREYTVEGEYGDHEYCVRPIYPGEMVLPDHNYGWSMGCPVCATPSGDFCAPVTNLIGEYQNIEGMEGLYIDWEEPEGAVSFILYLDGEQTAELNPGDHPIFIALPNGFPAFTMNVGVVAVHEDCVSEMEQVDIFYDDVKENGDNVALYPNPTNGNVTIEATGMSRITVVSMLGQVVFDTELDADVYTLNMAQFNAGMYMVRVYTEEGMTVKRVTVMQ